MNVEYIEDNGYVVETKQAIYVFDFVKGNISGHYLRRGKPVVFLVSKDHPRHYSQSIMAYDKTIIFPKGIGLVPFRKTFVMDDKESLHLGFAKIFSFNSGDDGLAYLIIENDTKVFYAGSMDMYQDNSKKAHHVLKGEYEAAISPVLAYAPVDVLLFPVNPDNKVDYDEAARYAVVGLAPKVFFPTQFREHRAIRSFVDWGRSYKGTEFYVPTHSNRKYEGVL